MSSLVLPLESKYNTTIVGSCDHSFFFNTKKIDTSPGLSRLKTNQDKSPTFDRLLTVGVDAKASGSLSFPGGDTS